MGYLSSIFGGGVLEVFGIYQLPLNLGNIFFYMYCYHKRKKQALGKFNIKKCLN